MLPVDDTGWAKIWSAENIPSVLFSELSRCERSAVDTPIRHPISCFQSPEGR